MTALLNDPDVDTVVPIFVPPFGVRQEDVADAIVGATETTDKTVLAVLMGREGLPHGRAELQRAHIPTYIFPESAARALAALNRHAEWAARVRLPATLLDRIDRDAARAIVDGVRQDGREHFTQAESLALLGAYGIPTVRSEAAACADEAVRIADEIGYPVVLKILSPDIVHKTEVGGVRVGVSSADEVRSAFAAMLARARATQPTARLLGVLVQATVMGGCEVIAGMTRDPSFGPLVMFGLGGIFVEAMHDVVFRIAPLDDATAARNARGDSRYANARWRSRGCAGGSRRARRRHSANRTTRRRLSGHRGTRREPGVRASGWRDRGRRSRTARVETLIRRRRRLNGGELLAPSGGG